MTEDKVQYNAGDKVTPDNVNAAIRQITENYVAQLERTIDGYNMIQGRHAAMIAERDARIAELEQALHDTTAQLATATETIARLEQDNKRLRHLDAMPLDAMQRYHLFTHYDVHAANDAGYTTQQFDSDDEDIRLWLTSRDGDA